VASRRFRGNRNAGSAVRTTPAGKRSITTTIEGNMRVFVSATCLCVLQLLAAGGAGAQAKQQVVFTLGADLISNSIDPVAAENAGVGSRASGLQLTGGLTAFKVLSVNLEGGIVGMSDEAPFTQETTQGEKTSGVAAGMGSLSVGLRTPPLSLGGERPVMLAAGVNAGHTLLDVTRTITNCADCHGESVGVEAGNFWEPVVQLGRGRAMVNARYRTYTGDSNFQDALILGLAVTVERKAKPASPPAP
jgi:hypothetical protein